MGREEQGKRTRPSRSILEKAIQERDRQKGFSDEERIASVTGDAGRGKEYLSKD